MKNISTGLSEALKGEVLHLATCWKMTRRDGAVMGFTDHDANLVLEGQEYIAKTGFTPTAISATASLSVDNLDVEGVLDAASIRHADVLAGIYDFAEIEVFQMNYNHPEQGRLLLRRGWLGEITLHQGRFVAEVRGLTQKLSQQVGDLYSAACRAEFADSRCKMDKAAYTFQGVVSEEGSRHSFRDSARTEEDGYFAGGLVTFTTGVNAGLSLEVKEFTSGRFVMSLPWPEGVLEGEVYQAVAGCDKVFETCHMRFANSINFRGEPHVPGVDRLMETASTKSNW